MRLHDLCLPVRFWFASLFVLDLNGGNSSFPALTVEFHSITRALFYHITRWYECTTAPCFDLDHRRNTNAFPKPYVTLCLLFRWTKQNTCSAGVNSSLCTASGNEVKAASILTSSRSTSPVSSSFDGGGER